MVVNRVDSLAVQPPNHSDCAREWETTDFVGSIADQAVNPVSEKGAMTGR